MIEQGLTLMIYGIGTVFCFLTVLVIATGIMSKIIAAVTKDAPAHSNLPGHHSAPAVDALTLDVIRAAITQHRSRR